MFVYPAALFFLVFCVRVVSDPRRFSNAVLLGITVTLLASNGIVRAAGSGPFYRVFVYAALALLGVGALVLPSLLMANGVKMIRKEGRRVANLLSLLTGLAIFGIIALLITAAVSSSPTLVAVSYAVMPIIGYVSFLLLCFLCYAFLYGRLPVRRGVDFVVILGSGLTGGSRVPRLLANRLDRGRALYASQAARGHSPILLTSGGQGPDEDLPEADAMAAYLLDRGVPAEAILREDRSRTTEENLRFSRTIMEEHNPDYRCVIVTNNYHVFRAALEARHTDVRGQVIGAPTAAYFWPSATIREFIAVFLSHKVVNFGISLLLGVVGLIASFHDIT